MCMYENTILKKCYKKHVGYLKNYKEYESFQFQTQINQFESRN